MSGVQAPTTATDKAVSGKVVAVEVDSASEQCHVVQLRLQQHSLQSGGARFQTAAPRRAAVATESSFDSRRCTKPNGQLATTSVGLLLGSSRIQHDAGGEHLLQSRPSGAVLRGSKPGGHEGADASELKLQGPLRPPTPQHKVRCGGGGGGKTKGFSKPVMS